jgi:hypothetical protein
MRGANDNQHNKYKTHLCDNKMSFQECELAVLRQAVDESEARQGAKIANSPDVQKIIQILEKFLIDKGLVCYGGTAINNILPEEAQFYDRGIEVPDYDFFSPRAMEDARELANLYYFAGYEEVEAKAGVHVGTYKVYVNFLPIADITELHPKLYERLIPETIKIAGIRYAPPNYLRMSMYLELSRPDGDVSRWEKVLKRINLLNKYYPLTAKDCDKIDFQRGMDVKENKSSEESIYYLVRDSFIEQGAVFLGGYGTALYSKYMEDDKRHQVENVPDFDVLIENPGKCAMIIRDKLTENGYKNIKIIQHTSLGEVIPSNVEIRVNGDIIALIYKPIACHAYNKIDVSGKSILVATIDTMLSFYLAFLYADKDYFDKDRMLCMASYLSEVEHKNNLEQKGLLKRFSLDCYGKQPTLEEMRAEKAKKYEELNGSKSQEDKKAFERIFFKYIPSSNSKLKNKKQGNMKFETQFSNKTPAKTIILYSKNMTKNARKIARQSTYRRSTKPRKQKKTDDGPYTRRVFHFGRRK